MNKTIDAQSKLLCYQRTGPGEQVADPCTRAKDNHVFDHVMGLCRADDPRALLERVSWGKDDGLWMPMIRCKLTDTTYYLIPDLYSHEQIQAALMEKAD